MNSNEFWSYGIVKRSSRGLWFCFCAGFQRRKRRPCAMKSMCAFSRHEPWTFFEIGFGKEQEKKGVQGCEGFNNHPFLWTDDACIFFVWWVDQLAPIVMFGAGPGGSIRAGILQAIQYPIAFHCNSCDGYDWRVVQWSLGEPEMNKFIEDLKIFLFFCDLLNEENTCFVETLQTRSKGEAEEGRSVFDARNCQDDGTHFCTGSSSRGLWHPNGFDSAFCQLLHRGASWKCSWWGFSNWRLWVVYLSGGKDPDPCHSRGLDHSHEGAWVP